MIARIHITEELKQSEEFKERNMELAMKKMADDMSRQMDQYFGHLRERSKYECEKIIAINLLDTNIINSTKLWDRQTSFVKDGVDYVKNIAGCAMLADFGFDYDFLNNISIYAVNSKECGEKVFNNNGDSIIIPSDKSKHYEFDIENGITEVENTVLGLYCKNGYDFDIQERLNHRFIVLFIDHIEEQATDIACIPENLVAFVLLHELAHAAMDRYNKVRYNHIKDIMIEDAFIHFREESLAEAIALYFIKKSANKDAAVIEELTKRSSSAYRACHRYHDINRLKESIIQWVTLKEKPDAKINKWDAASWISKLIDDTVINEDILTLESILFKVWNRF